MHNFQLHRSTKGSLVLIDAAGIKHEGIVPVHAFPITAPELGVALVDAEGHELVWLDNLSDLSADIRALVLEELASREFIPEILSIKQVSTFATPSIWEVETDRGVTSFILKVEEDIRRLNNTTLLIADRQGIHFLIRNIEKMDKNTRRILDRFL